VVLVKSVIFSACALVAFSSPLFALTKAKIKRGPSYRDAEQSFGGAIRLDKRSYSGVDRIRIVLIAPDANLSSSKRDVVGDGTNGEVTVKTRNGKLENYRLVETGANTGIFYGYVTLKSAIPDKHGKADDAGIVTGGKGPYYGTLKSDGQRDGLSVYWKPSQGGRITQYADVGRIRNGKSSKTKPVTAITSVGVAWTLARIDFDQDSYTPGGSARIRVHDPGMNRNADQADSISLFVFSESDIAGVSLQARETRKNSGMFEARVSFTPTQSSSGSRLRAHPGDRVYGLYRDTTLPKPYGKGDVKKLEAVAQIR
jgi:hypothetical protein